MSIERHFEPWGEFHRHGQDLADRLAQGFTGLIAHPPSFKNPFEFETLASSSSKLEFPSAAADGVSAIFDMGSRIGQAGAEFGAGLNGMVEQFFRQLPAPFRLDSSHPEAIREGMETRRRDDASDLAVAAAEEQIGTYEVLRKGSSEEFDDDELDSDARGSGRFRRARGSINFSTTYNSRSEDIESTFTARGDLWRVEASNGGSASGNQNAPLFLVQLGPLLFVRDSTLLLPVHLSKQHLLWYGYDRKNGMHSLCPALWSKHRRWLLMSMIRLNPVTCSFMDLQFPNGQLTYVAGEGLTTSAFLPVRGGLLQAQGRYPGETKVSFSCKNKKGTRITPMMQWPDKSFSLGIAHPIAWKRSGLMVRPTVQFSICPTIGGSNPGLGAELIHSVKEELNLICGYACNLHPSAYALVSLGRSKWNGHVGKSGAVFRVEAPLGNIGRPFFSIQLNGGFEF
ncbi:uncharacterized protein M6B38_290595 [Iris pallida]|uniref:Uncharacterized protein n=1 Tax=Iris pallida TaxID=29817 RepID=A0AAX6F652_IRIPA|nr:uncharacterized protein M6B38_150260 [Iris pallida]KAJ6844130.1 uncharacterized protein M6B38_290595 [Iris pallida]